MQGWQFCQTQSRIDRFAIILGVTFGFDSSELIAHDMFNDPERSG